MNFSRDRSSGRTRVLLGSILIATSLGIAIPASAGSAYTPTMKDMMSIEAAMHRYHEGLDKSEYKVMASAFTPDGTLTIIDHGKAQKPVSHDQIAVGALYGDAPPPGARGGTPAVPNGTSPAAPDRNTPAMDMGALWHFTEVNSYFEFESATRATHYAYWMDVHVHEESHSSTLGVPGHYEDVFVKRNGEWLILSRKILVGTK